MDIETQSTAIEDPGKQHQSNFHQGWALFKSSIAFIFKKPTFLMPIFLCWVIVAAIVLYLDFWWVAPASLGLLYLELFLLARKKPRAFKRGDECAPGDQRLLPLVGSSAPWHT